MDDEKVWLHHPETDGYFQCPVDAVDAWRDRGWEVAEQPPAEPNPVAAEHLAWREQQDQAAAVAEQTKKPSKSAARRGAENGVNDG